MLAYYILLSVPIFVKMVSLTNERNTLSKDRIENERKVLICFFAIFIVLLALRRGDIGIDLVNYKNNFENIVYYSWDELSNHHLELGYVFLNKLVHSIAPNFQVFLGVLAIVSVAPIMYLYCRESENAIITIGLFICLSLFDMYFSGLRQMLATAFIVPAYYFTKNKKLFKFLICVFLAYCCHKSALVFLAFYPMYHIKLKKSSIFVIAPVMAAVFVFRSKVFDILLTFLGEDYQDKYSTQRNTGAYTVLLLFLLFVVYTVILINDENADKDTMGLRNILVLATCIQFFASVNSVAMRMNFYFIPFLSILISRVYHYVNEEDRAVVSFANILMSIFFVAYFLYKGHSNIDPLNIFPYKTFWM